MNDTDWFTETATPMPHLRAWFRVADGSLTYDPIVLLLVQREYPATANRGYLREPGSDWLDTRTVFAASNIDGEVMPVNDVGNFLGLFPAELPAEVIHRLTAKADA